MPDIPLTPTPPDSATYHVLHETLYPYDSQVALSQQMLHLEPRPCAWQFCHEQLLRVAPAQNWQRSGIDAFGNPVSWVVFDEPHESLQVSAEMVIEVLSHPPLIALADSPPWEEMRQRLAYHAQPLSDAELDACRFCFESDYVRIKSEFAAYAADCFPAGRPLLVGVQALMEKIHEEFTFDPRATSVATPVTALLDLKRGVCQDYAHFMLSCLRSLGLPARYMSGYLLTRPPAGKPRLIGADASHAWVAVFCPEASADGWIAFDPTNNLIPDTEHITLAWGRDFGDVSPMRGVILGGGKHDPVVEVTVMPEEEWQAWQAQQAAKHATKTKHTG